jgi:hypothetical protein
MDAILTGKVFWTYDYEALERDPSNDFAYHFGIPFHKHEGEITLTDVALIITGDEDLSIPLGTITQIALGFDENYPATLVKNFGLLWQPLRMTLQGTDNIYLILDYDFLFGPRNRHWFNILKEMLSQ